MAEETVGSLQQRIEEHAERDAAKAQLTQQVQGLEWRVRESEAALVSAKQAVEAKRSEADMENDNFRSEQKAVLRLGLSELDYMIEDLRSLTHVLRRKEAKPVPRQSRV